MYLSTFVVLFSLTVGIVGSYYLVKGTLSATIQFIHDQTGAATRVIGNFVFAKGAIVQKSQTIIGFFLLAIAFFIQLIAVFIKETMLDITIPIPRLWFISILAIIAIIIDLIVRPLMKSRECKDGLDYVRLVFKDMENDEKRLNRVDDKFCGQIADLLCLDDKYNGDVEGLKTAIKNKLEIPQ